MERVLEVIYSGGVLRPLEPLALPDNQRMMIRLQLPAQERPSEALAAWQEVYAGLSDEEIAEIEDIALDRSRFMREDI